MPYGIVREFERRVAEYAGAKHAIAVESGSAAILLSCMYVKVGRTYIPARTYPSVPCSIILAGGSVVFLRESWDGAYELRPYNIWDGALRFRRKMYAGGLHCLSFHIRKHLPIGRGGMILTNDPDAARWLRLARFDGREECGLNMQGRFEVIGVNAYMMPEQAARGILLFDAVAHKELADLPVEEQGYPDLEKSPVYTAAAVRVAARMVG
jgi:dTDP-4-amino-4,6-dideoxygalactose transaminase